MIEANLEQLLAGLEQILLSPRVSEHRHLKLRGINARVVQAGSCESGGEVRVV